MKADSWVLVNNDVLLCSNLTTDNTRKQAKVKEKPQMPYCRNVHSRSFARPRNIWKRKQPWKVCQVIPNTVSLKLPEGKRSHFTQSLAVNKVNPATAMANPFWSASEMASMYYMGAMFYDNCANMVTLSLWNTMGMPNTAGLSSFCACTFWSH